MTLIVPNIGDIIGVHSCPVRPKPKFKYLICVDPIKRVGFVINSEDREHFYCIPINKKDHSFLRTDSFISCSNPMSYESKNIDKIYSSLSRTELLALYRHVEAARKLTPIEKKNILQNLDSRLESSN
jgi:hypothetical protein